ncbi:hypothetical protein KNV11_gp33 [Flavobacterium phage vB_FspP_elemoF_6-3D]|uniref:Uncharacterized protein n=1 Tax=Flavobacterium phage vB_FspP_elemoF_6-3D TaxID=2743826 RepID=A0A7D7FHF5_9CAUD|nr:hypothetical protein KNV11_gp33 [Flavobacterium phage vB_FspP_elemoF_6-3D]QMP85236.1 hypothetical protein elemo63D_phanotate73 [Flavobacterium phage vB_FspP_elemoF_6-3D]QMP86310.1 hypothetical protein elemo119C_phanotate76 [Flavobacterium phage vB_FspP_elemoA_11-9C]
MARIKTYTIDTLISDNDIIIGSDADNNNETKNFSAGLIREFVLSGLEPEVGGNLKITTIVDNDSEETTPEDYFNNSVTPIIVLHYEIVFLILNGRTFIFRKNNDTYGVDETQVVSGDFTEIDITSVINANLQDLDSVLTEGNEAPDKDAKIRDLYLYDDFGSPDGYARLYSDKQSLYFMNKTGESVFQLEKNSLYFPIGAYTYKITTPSITGGRIATFQDASGIVAYTSDIPTDYISSITSSSDELDITTVAGETTIIYTPKKEIQLIGTELSNNLTNTTFFSNGGEFSYDETLYPITALDLKFNYNIDDNGIDFGYYVFHYEDGRNVIAPIEFAGSIISGTELRVRLDLATYWTESPDPRLSYFEINLYQGTLISEDGVYFDGHAPSSQIKYFNIWT